MVFKHMRYFPFGEVPFSVFEVTIKPKKSIKNHPLDYISFFIKLNIKITIYATF